ncbi:MAG: thermonuclease family protein [Chloroflexi bacterium]|nr:thermonuclease family protein [Chloroflexota bacterium]
MRSKYLVISLTLAMLLSACAPATAPLTPATAPSTTTRVIDGDTIELQDGRHVRYLGIDTPETVHPTKPVQPFGPEASARNTELVEGKTVYLQKGQRDIDEYGRFLRYVYVDGTFVNAELVAEGLARAYIFDTADWYSQTLVQLEQYAKLRQRGLWGQ